jgi:hypothetical protein
MEISNCQEDGEDTSWVLFRGLLSTNRRTVAASQPITSHRFNQPLTCITCIKLRGNSQQVRDCTVYQAAGEHETWTAVWARGMTTKRSNNGSPRSRTRASCSCVRSKGKRASGMCGQVIKRGGIGRLGRSGESSN